MSQRKFLVWLYLLKKFSAWSLFLLFIFGCRPSLIANYQRLDTCGVWWESRLVLFWKLSLSFLSLLQLLGASVGSGIPRETLVACRRTPVKLIIYNPDGVRKNTKQINISSKTGTNTQSESPPFRPVKRGRLNTCERPSLDFEKMREVSVITVVVFFNLSHGWGSVTDTVKAALFHHVSSALSFLFFSRNVWKRLSFFSEWWLTGAAVMMMILWKRRTEFVLPIILNFVLSFVILKVMFWRFKLFFLISVAILDTGG